MIFDLVEKKDHDVIHASFASLQEAQDFDVTAYVTRNLYCLRKGLRAEDFEIIEGEP